MSPFTKVEGVSRRADELLSVNQPLAALSSMSEVFSSKRFRTTPLSTLEPILIKFLGLCVDLRKGRTAKEGLHMYKNVAQNTSVASVEVVVQKFLDQSRAKLTEALAKVDELEGPAEKAAATVDGVAADVEDLEASETPESILLSTVSEEKSRDRTYRTLVTPWLRFLWESYRTALDILRNNARLEVLYQTVSHDAFAFCLAHQRKTEFRRLSETLRSHLTSSQKYSHQSHSINLNDSDTLQRHLDTRFQQLSTAVDLELWQEAFRTAEDIHTLVGMSKRAPKASMMATFYDKMVKVFGVGQNYLFHAAAYGKLYSLHAAKAAVSGEKAEDAELEKLSSLVLLSALAVPLGSGLLGEGGKRRDSGDEGEAKGKLGRLAALLGLASAPTRAGLINDALNRQVLKRVSPELRDLYTILEVDFHPLSITSKIEPILASLALRPETERYVAPLKDVVLARLFQQLAQVYQSLKIERVVRLASFGAAEDSETTRRRVERFVTEACRRGDLDVTIDHASGAIRFDEDLFGSDATPVASTSAQYDSVNTLQPSASTLLRTHLTRLASTLYATLDIVSPHNSPIASALASRALAFTNLEAHGSDERDEIVSRTQIIKRRKELADEQTAKQAQEDAYQRTIKAQLKAEADAKKAQDDIRNREIAKMQRELAAQKKAETDKLAAELAARTGLAIDTTDPELGKEQIMLLSVQHIEKEKKDLAQKLSGVAKRIDHLERAYRKEEIPLLKQDYERQQKSDREAFISTQASRLEAQRKQHAEDLAIKGRLVHIMGDYRQFRQRVEKDSRAAFEREAEVKAEQLAEAKAARRAEYKARQEQEEAHRRQEEQEAEARRERQEEADRAAAEANAAEEAERAAIEERQRALAEAANAEKAKRLAEREAERQADREKIAKQLAIEEAALARRQNGIKPPAAPLGAPAVGSAAWREARAGAATGERPRIALQPRTASFEQPAPTPVRAAPAPVAAPTPRGPPVVVAPGAKPTWREREAARLAAGGAESPSSDGARSPQPQEGARPSYRPPGAGGAEAPRNASGGAYKPPSARTQDGDAPPRSRCVWRVQSRIEHCYDGAERLTTGSTVRRGACRVGVIWTYYSVLFHSFWTLLSALGWDGELTPSSASGGRRLTDVLQVITTASTGSFLIFLGVDLFVNRIDGMSLGLRYLFDHNAVHKAALSAYSPPTSTRLFLGMTWLLTFVSSIFQIFVWRHAPFIRTYDSLSAFDRKSNPQLDQEGRQMAPSPNLVGTYITEGHSHDSFASRINHRYRHTAQPSDPFGSFNDKPTMRSAATEMHMPQASSFDILRGHQSMASPDEPPSPPASIVSTTFADGLQSRPPTFFDIPASQPTLSTNPSAPLFNPFPDVPVSPTDVSFNIPVVAVSAKESVQSSIPFVPPIPSSAAGARHDSSTSRSSSRSDESRRSWRKRVPDFPEPPMALSTAFPRDSVVQRDLERGLASGRNVSIAPSTNYPDLSTMLGKGSGYAGIGSGTTYPSDARVGRRKEAAEKADEIYSGTPGGNRRNPDLTTSADVVKHPSWSAMPTFAQRLSQGSGTASTNADWIGREGTPEFGHGREDSSDWNSASPVTPTAPYVTSRVVGKRSVEEGRRLAEL
ncbi:translation initiation factor 3 subunit A, partial [Phenoliferia sp. Uapishka_3]